VDRRPRVVEPLDIDWTVPPLGWNRTHDDEEHVKLEAHVSTGAHLFILSISLILNDKNTPLQRFRFP
jgi:imidazoleglycerol phosphate synthase glutamine amidotransferase subunit HisH